MAIDFLILALLIISFIINLLALCAFWITPGLRTTANRFTINLLIINLIGCCILAPTLFLSGLKSLDSGADDGETIEFYSKAGNHQLTIRRHGQVVEQDGIVLRRNITKNNSDTIEMFYKCNTSFCRELTIDERSDGNIVITETETHQENLSTPAPELLALPSLQLRCWSIDMAAALGALAVLLVVGDTWCAVTDPLRYHSRISGVKTWIFIALTWTVGILFGALSAFRVLDFEADTLLSRQRRLAATYFNISSTNSIFGIVFACVYFIVIILLPFGFVCGMYWRIFSEARGNGLRMRQNGSSPLLQSALNLNQQSNKEHNATTYANSLCVHRHSISSASSHGGGVVVGGLQMQIDARAPRNSPSCLRRDSAAKVLLPTISDDGSDVDVVVHTAVQLMSVPEQTLAERTQNILLTLQTASGEIKRNYSARQLPLLGTSSQDLRELHRLQGIRQVHSSPNLHKYTQLRQDSLTLSDNYQTSHPLQTPVQQSPQQQQPAALPQQLQPAQAATAAPQLHFTAQRQQSLQIPAIHASPKALSYMSSLRHRLSNASSLFKYREESRAARISILVVVISCSTIINFGAAQKSSADSADEGTSLEATPPPPKRTARPKLQRGITIVEHIHIPGAAPKFQSRRGLLDMFFRNPRKLQSSSCSEPTEV
ncbi:CG12290 [Drosophila busckii]|uniref:CG12290 n=1 Tax=Drosophila busckii TaxID=30019 RepID=A0A0M5J1T1_DROBS|nr:CG12290 [Drosophila busckii]